MGGGRGDELRRRVDQPVAVVRQVVRRGEGDRGVDLPPGEVAGRVVVVVVEVVVALAGRGRGLLLEVAEGRVAARELVVLVGALDGAGAAVARRFRGALVVDRQEGPEDLEGARGHGRVLLRGGEVHREHGGGGHEVLVGERGGRGGAAVARRRRRGLLLAGPVLLLLPGEELQLVQLGDVVGPGRLVAAVPALLLHHGHVEEVGLEGEVLLAGRALVAAVLGAEAEPEGLLRLGLEAGQEAGQEARGPEVGGAEAAGALAAVGLLLQEAVDLEPVGAPAVPRARLGHADHEALPEPAGLAGRAVLLVDHADAAVLALRYAAQVVVRAAEEGL